VLVGHETVLQGRAVRALGWLRGRLTVALPGVVFSPALDGAPQHSAATGDSVEAITPKVVVVRNGPKVVAGRTTLLTVPRDASVRDVQIG
jgi:hypothetical protein